MLRAAREPSDRRRRGGERFPKRPLVAPGVDMKRHHLFAFYCSLLVPVGALAGAEAGDAIALPALLMLLGMALGVAASYALLRSTASGDAP